MTTLPEQARDNAIAAAETAADPALVAAVDAVIARWTTSGRKFSANTIRGEVPTPALHLVGGRLRAAALRRPVEIVAVDEIGSDLTSTHAKPIKVWQSRLAAELAGWGAAS